VSSAAPARPYAGIVTRAVAFTVDALVINAATVVLVACGSLVLSVLFPDGTDWGLSGLVASLGAWWLAGAVYFPAFWTLTGQTIGMRIMRLRVGDARDVRPGLGRAVVRLVGMWLAALPLMAGYALILFDRRRQGLHDKLAGTFVRHAVVLDPRGAGDQARDRPPYAASP
jgi:uncharacterized RDD family membrane protein YckC